MVYGKTIGKVGSANVPSGARVTKEDFRPQLKTSYKPLREVMSHSQTPNFFSPGGSNLECSLVDAVVEKQLEASGQVDVVKHGWMSTLFNIKSQYVIRDHTNAVLGGKPLIPVCGASDIALIGLPAGFRPLLGTRDVSMEVQEIGAKPK